MQTKAALLNRSCSALLKWVLTNLSSYWVHDQVTKTQQHL